MLNIPKNINELHEIWRKGEQRPDNYFCELKGNFEELTERSKLVEKMIRKCAISTEVKILEIGSNTGRDLYHLYLSGFENLTGIEICDGAMLSFKEVYPEISNNITLYILPIEKIIKEIKTNSFDIVFTMAVLEHMHVESEWIFSETVRITKDFYIAIEDEGYQNTWRDTLCNYKNIFEDFSMTQIEERNCGAIHELHDNFWACLFKK